MRDRILDDTSLAFSASPAVATRRRAANVAATLAERSTQFETALAAFPQRAEELAAIASALIDTLRGGRQVLVAGNGGSAAEAQHFVAELVGRFKLERRPYAAIALCVDSAVLTAVSNDYGFDDVFARQVLALGRPGDLFLAYSTSGESENLVRAARAARSRGLIVAAITGDRPNRLEAQSDLTLRVPATDTPLVQELHMIVTHVLCGIAESELATLDRETGS